MISESTAVASDYELFTPGDCNQPLPLNQITDVFRFSQFVYLARSVDGRDVRVVLPNGSLNSRYARSLAARNPNATRIDLFGGVPLGARLKSAGWSGQLAQRVSVPDLDALLSGKSISSDGRQYALRLDPPAIRDLLAGRDAVVPATSTQNDKTASQHLLRLSPRAGGGRPAVLEWQIQDLPAFLARPQIPALEGTMLSLTMESETIAELRRRGRAEVRVGDVQVTLSLGTQTDAALMRLAQAADQRGAVSALHAQVAIGSVGRPNSATPAPGRSVLPRFDLVLNLQWKQTWELLGYSRGTLLNTVSLAPQEETTIEIFTWDRRKDDTERTSSVESEENVDRSDTVRDTTDVMRQAQSNSEFGFQGNMTLGIKYEDVLNVSENVGASEKNAFAGLTKTTTNFVHEAVVKSANRVKQSRQTKVSESREQGREERVTRKIRNANMCHTMNLDYFEVLSNYSVTTAFVPEESGLCVLLDNPIKFSFDRWTLRVYEASLSRYLIDRALAPGFAAAQLLDSRDRACQVLCYRCYCDTDAAPLGADAMQTIGGILNSIGSIVAVFENSRGYIEQWFDLFENFDEASMRNPAYYVPARWWVYAQLLRISHSSLYNALLSVRLEWQNHTPFGEATAGRLRYEMDALGGIAGLSADRMYNEKKDVLLRTLAEEYGLYLQDHPGAQDLNQWNAPANPFFADLEYSELLDAFDDDNLQYLLSQFVTAYDALKKAQADADTAKAQAQADRNDAVLSAYGLREVTDAMEREAALLAHLNLYGSYYRAMLWNSMPPMEQLEFLRALLPLSIVEPHAVGFIGDQLAFPVKLDLSPEASDFVDQLITQNAAVSALARTETVTLPTSSVTVESRLGMCDGCEDFVQKQRELELTSKDLQNQLLEQEVARYTARLGGTSPLLDDPKPASSPLHIIVEQVPTGP